MTARTTRSGRGAATFRRTRTTVARVLSRVSPVPVRPEFAGFLVLGSLSFAVDLVVLTALRDVAGLPVWASYALAYLVAQAVNFALNRQVNFDARDEPVGPELRRYAVVVVVTYLGIVLGLGVGLHHLGLHFLLARVLAAVVEVVFVYSAMRFWVFARPGR